MKNKKIYITAVPGQCQELQKEKRMIEENSIFSVIIGSGTMKEKAVQMAECDSIYLLKGWDESDECIREFQLALLLGLKSIL